MSLVDRRLFLVVADMSVPKRKRLNMTGVRIVVKVYRPRVTMPGDITTDSSNNLSLTLTVSATLTESLSGCAVTVSDSECQRCVNSVKSFEQNCVVCRCFSRRLSDVGPNWPVAVTVTAETGRVAVALGLGRV